MTSWRIAIYTSGLYEHFTICIDFYTRGLYYGKNSMQNIY